MAIINRFLALGAISLFLVSLAGAQEESQTVSYSTTAKTADLVIAEIAELSGLTLETKADAKSHVLVIHVTDTDVDVLLNKIASVTSSVWNKQSNKRVLIPNTNLRKREKTEAVARTAEEIRKGLAKLQEQLAEEPEDNPFNVGMMGMFGGSLGSPADRALAQLALMLDPNDIAQLADDGRIVYSTDANRMQRSMRGSKVNQILNVLFKEHNAYADEAIKERQEMMAEMGEENSAMMGFMQMMMGDSEPQKFTSAPAKALLVVETGGMLSFMSDAYQLELKVYDQEGNAIAMAQVPLGADTSFMDAVEMMSEEEDPEAVQQSTDKTDLVQIELSEKSKMYAETNIMDFENLQSMSPELRAFLMDPVTHDPLSFTNSDTLISIAKAKNLDVVANLPDGEMTDAFMGMLTEQASTVGQALEMLENSDEIRLDTEDGWLLLRPTNPIAARDLRQDRVALKALIDIAEKKGTVDLDSIAAFALKSPEPQSNATTMKYIGYFVPTLMQGVMGDTMDWDMLRFYGSLPSATKVRLMSGSQVPFSAIGGNARNHLNKMAFGANANILPAAGLESSANEPQFMQMMKMMMPGGKKNYTEEPTEVMPNGLPANGFVVLNVSAIPILKPENSAGPTMFSVGALGPEEIAMLEFFQEAAGEMGEMMMPELGQLRMGSRQNLRFTFWLSPEAGLSKTLQDDSIAKDGQMVSLSNLPPAFRALIAKAKEQIKNSPMAQLGMMFGGMGERQIDPPKPN